MSQDLPPLNALRAFEAAARLHSVSQAADELHVTHGAVSRQIRALEEHLGLALFAREGRGLKLTDAGVRLRDVSSELFARLRSTCAELQQGQADAPFVLACPGSLLARWIGSNIERRRYLDAQIEVAERLKKVSSQLPGMVFQFRQTAEGNFSFPYCSEGINTLFHLTPEQVKQDATPLFALVHPDDRDSVQQGIRQSAETLSLWKQDHRIQHHDGEVVWLAGRAAPESQPDGSILWHGFVSDITERKKIERLKDEFVSTVSHELRTPLTAISGAIGLLHGQVFGQLPAQAMQMTELAQANVKKLQILINDLLDMDKLIAVGFEPTYASAKAVSELIDKELPLMRAVAQRAAITAD